MKDLFFLLLCVYLGSLIFGSFASIVRFWVDVAKFHPHEEKEPRLTKKQFEQSMKEAASESEVSENG